MLLSFSLFSQTKPEIKKIEIILGKGFTKTEAQEYYLKTDYQNVNADTSLVMKYDTTGIHKNGEYLMFRNPLTYDKRKESFKLIKQSPVTVQEYNEFVGWVMDSIAREKLFFGLLNETQAHKLLIKHQSECSTQCLSSREEARKKYPFNWKGNLDYNNRDYVPILADLYLAQPERFYRKIEFDKRKLIYSYNEFFNEYPSAFISELRNNSSVKISKYGNANIILQKDDYPRSNLNQINISPEYALLAFSDSLLYAETSVISKVYGNLFVNNPIYGLQGTQASAYCSWLQKKINLELSIQGIDLIAKVTLPNTDDVIEENNENIIIPQFDYTEYWKINANEYQQFSDYVRDSIIKESLYLDWTEDDRKALELINYKEVFFDEGSLEFDSMDVSDRQMNFYLFPLNQKLNLEKFCEEITYGNWIDTVTLDLESEVNNNTIRFYDYQVLMANRKGLPYRYYTEDIGAQAFRGAFTYDQNSGDYILDFENKSTTFEPLKNYENRMGYEENPSIKGQDLIIGGWINDLGTDLSIRRHSNYQTFILNNITLVKVDNLNINESNVMLEQISYEQALAFYSWKYPRWKMNSSDNNWQQFVFPTKEQFETIQKGEKIIIPEHSIEYPTPLFRYVVHFYEK